MKNQTLETILNSLADRFGTTVSKLHSIMLKQARVNTPAKGRNEFKTALQSPYIKNKQELTIDIAEFETMETCSSLHYELNTRIIDALQGDLLVLEAYKLLELVS